VVIYAITALFSGAAILLHYVDHFAVEAGALLAALALVGLILARLGYLLSMWNSHVVVRLRRRLISAQPEAQVGPGAERSERGD
jgi:hypothetical protein